MTQLQATVEDLDPPPALSTNPSEPLVSALQSAYERDYTHLTVVSTQSRALLGYVAIPRARDAVAAGKVRESDPVANAMVRFDRRKKGAGGKGYTVITMDTPLEVLEQFFEGRLAGNRAGERNDFAVVTDAERKFVLGVVTREDLEEFVKRRPT